MQPVIRSLLETDLYKFTMWQAMLHRHPQTQAEYLFICRNARDYPLTHLIAELNEQLDHLCTLRFQPDELAYLAGLRFIKSDFVDFLRIFQFQRDFIEVRDNQGTLEIVARGPQVHVMAFEIHVLATVNELYFRRFDQATALAEGRRRLAEKVQMLRDFYREPARRHPFEFFDFGVRRRFSGAWHREMTGHDAPRRIHEAHDRVAGHRLARAGLAHEAEDLPPRDAETHVVHGPHHARLGEEMHPQAFDLEHRPGHRLSLGFRTSRSWSATRLIPTMVRRSARPG